MDAVPTPFPYAFVWFDWFYFALMQINWCCFFTHKLKNGVDLWQLGDVCWCLFYFILFFSHSNWCFCYTFFNQIFSICKKKKKINIMHLVWILPSFTCLSKCPHMTLRNTENDFAFHFHIKLSTYLWRQKQFPLLICK